MKIAALASTLILLATTSLAFAEVKVMASIKPIHSLVASVMQGVGTPGLIVSGNNSPHTYALKPNDAKALQEANVVFWVGPGLEAFLEKPLQSLAENASVISLRDAPGIQTLPLREGDGFDKDDDEGVVHEAGGADGHIWLDPENAKVIVQTIAVELSKRDPANAAAYSSNAKQEIIGLDRLSNEIAGSLAPAKGKGFIVFHDAYHYFENRFGLKASGAISIHPESPPGAKDIATIKQRISDGKVICVFAEPQFDNALIATLIDGTHVKAATLDPEGATLEPGPSLYGQLLHNITDSLTKCLS